MVEQVNRALSGDQSFLLEQIERLLAESGFDARLRYKAIDEWNYVSNKVDYLPVSYSVAMIDYYLAYFRGADQIIHDISVVIFHDNRPCAIWPLSLRPDTEEPVGTNGMSIVPPLFLSVFSKKSEKKLLKCGMTFLENALKFYQGIRWKSSETFQNMLGVSKWHQLAMKHGAVASIQHDLFVDLSLSLDDIKLSFRKSYKPLISSGKRLWEVFVLDCADASVWAEFENLHKVASGRVTRSAESWEMQHLAIDNGGAFLVYLRDDGHRMVGGGLFYTTLNESLYVVGAYDRDLFDKPLGHVVQFRAIEEMKKRGLDWYCIGIRSYPTDYPTPTPKEITISEFKQGFSTHIFPKYNLKYEHS